MNKSTTVPASTPAESGRGFFGHPWGLANLAGVEMWERFSFYGMQSLLLGYIVLQVSSGGLGMSAAEGSSIIGAYAGWVYLAAVIGSWISDRLLGSERTLVLGASIIMAGHIALSTIPGIPGLVTGLVLVGLGSGTLKATTSTVLGSMCSLEDRRRDAAFSIYYMGVNIGAFVGQIVTVLVADSTGNYHWGFILAAIGMALGLGQYFLMRRHTRNANTMRVPNPITRSKLMIYVAAAAVVVVLVFVLFGTGVLTALNLAGVISMVIVVVAVILFAVLLTSKSTTSDERRRVRGFIPLFIGGTVFWALFQQQFTVVPLYAKERVDLNVFGWNMPFNMVNSIQPLFVILLAGVFAAMWTKLGDRQPSTPAKFAAGTVLMGLAFLAFLPFTSMANGTGPLLAIVVILFIFTLAELSISPVGQSLATKLAPAKFQTQMVALYFLTISLGSSLAGYLGQLYAPESPEAFHLPENMFFLLVGGASILVGIALFLARKPILKLTAPVL